MVDDLFGAAPLEGASLLAARFPRAYIDPNRRLDDVDPVLLDGTWPEPLSSGPKSALGIGLFRHRTNDGNPLLPSPLPVAALRARIERSWPPYHPPPLHALAAPPAPPRARSQSTSSVSPRTGTA